ncbi:hypothetical protein CEW89_08365 [Celeribacter ethanolicus]|uniref:Uncharacterized protein n=1 Tax=Celeribacter ethanolicus TaxID=1758178 RepID=A0A291GC63_9RHOB|nr:hypothetical protein [Celeribacter ethanolicus]ATG47586.1 hypothetical protein CEW89_08365 [Celeribacter ethanolicus]
MAVNTLIKSATISEIDARVAAAQGAALDAQTAAGTKYRVATWAELALVSGLAGESGRVDISDTGEHTDPITAATVPNAGFYAWEADGLGSAQAKRVSGLGIEEKADQSGVDAEITTRAASIGALVRNGLESRASVAIQKGINFDFANGEFASAGVIEGSLDGLSGFSSTRAGTAYALNVAGVYTSFATNVFRFTDRGALIESDATQLCSQPVDFSNADWTKTGATAVSVAAGAPDGVSAAYDLTESATSESGQAYILFTSEPLSAGYYTASFHVERGDNRYTMLLATVNGQSGGWVVDFDAAKGPTFTWASGSGVADVAHTIEDIGGGVYRISTVLSLNSTGTIAMRLQGCGGLTYADRTYATTADNVFVRGSFAQLEAGKAATSPILTGGGSRAADVAVMTLPDGSSGDRIAVTWTGGRAEFTRGDLLDGGEIDLVADAGAPWGGQYIQSVVLTPAFDDTLLEPTVGGAVPWMVVTAGTYALNGVAYLDEAAIIASLGGTLSGAILTASGYVAPDAPNLLADDDFSEWTLTNGATRAVASGVLSMEVTGTDQPHYVAREIAVDGSKAYKISGTARQSLSAGQARLSLSLNPTFGGGPYLSSGYLPTTDTEVSVIGSASYGDKVYLGIYQLANSPALTAYLTAPSLKEVSPGPGFPSGNNMIELVGTMPGSLPEAAQVLAQVDGGTEADRWRVTWETDGSVVLSCQIQSGANSQSASITLGTVAAGADFHLIAGQSQSALRGAVNGVGDDADVILPVGAAALRIGVDSAGGSTFGGTITAKTVFGGLENLLWMKQRTQDLSETGPIKVWFEGDSYSGNTTGMAQILAGALLPTGDRQFDIVRTGVGGSTLSEQSARIIAAAADYADRVLVWFDGDPNGHTIGDTATDIALIDAAIAAVGHTRFLYVRNGQIPKPSVWGDPITSQSSESADMDVIFEHIKQTYGPQRVYDPLNVLREYVSDANDASDVEYGYFPRSLRISSSDVHMTIDSRRNLAAGLPGIPGLAEAISMAAKLS